MFLPKTMENCQSDEFMYNVSNIKIEETLPKMHGIPDLNPTENSVEMKNIKIEDMPSCFGYVIADKREYIAQCKICDVLLDNSKLKQHLNSEYHKFADSKLNGYLCQKPTSTNTKTDSIPNNDSLNLLDRDIKRILDSKIKSEEKWFLYSQILHKYAYLLAKPPEIKEKSKQTKSVVVKKKECTANLCVESNILQELPKSHQDYAMELLSYLSKSDAIRWIEDGTIFVEKKMVKKSNIVKLIKDVLSNKQKSDPIGWKKFANILKQINFPLQYIGNTKRREHIIKLHNAQIRRVRIQHNQDLVKAMVKEIEKSSNSI